VRAIVWCGLWFALLFSPAAVLVPARCIDNYIQARQSEETAVIDDRLVSVVDRMFERCFADGEYKQALGIALESRRLDMVEAAICGSPNVPDMLSYCFRLCLSLMDSRKARSAVLQLLVRLYRAQAQPNYFDLARAFQFLGDAKSVAETLNLLLSAEDEKSHVSAYQVGFDIVDNQNQQFQHLVVAHLPVREQPKKDTPADDDTGAGAGETSDGGDSNPAADGEDVAMDDAEEEVENAEYWDRIGRMTNVLNGDVTVDLHVDFLAHHNHADLQILQNIKEAIPVRNSMLRHSAIMCHGLMQCGTTIDTFLLNNLPWLRQAKDWDRFSATAAQGVVHKGHVRESMRVLEPYLPRVRIPCVACTTHTSFTHRGSTTVLGGLRALASFNSRT